MLAKLLLLAACAFLGHGIPPPTYQVQTLVPSNVQPGDLFGTIVAASGDLVVSTAPQFNNGVGAAFIYHCPSSSNCELTQQINSPVNVANEQFGFFAAVSGKLVILSALTPDSTGVVFVYLCPTPYTCELQSTICLQGHDPQPGDEFGFYLWAQHNRVLIGAPGRHNAKGAAYLYDCEDARHCELLDVLTASDGKANNLFGDALGFFGDLVAIGASNASCQTGAVYVYDCKKALHHRDGCEQKNRRCREIAILLPSPGTNAGAQFGLYVVVVDRRIYVTADQFEGVGLGYVFECPKDDDKSINCGCRLTSTFQPAGLAPNDQFGAFLAVQGFQVVVTAQNHAGSGAGYLYNCENPYHCELEQYLLPHPGQDGELFGATTNFAAHQILITAPNRNSNTGAVYAFRKESEPKRRCGCPCE